ncbi:MAG: hypothetical protein ABMA14_00460 [Hyphomonadaceae bacterium]
MSDVMMLWIVCGVLAVLASMIVVLIVSRSLDGSREEANRKFAATMMDLAGRASRHGETSGGSGWSGSGWLSGAMAGTLTALASSATEGKGEAGKPETDGRKQIKAAITGIAVMGGILLAIVGILVGDGS